MSEFKAHYLEMKEPYHFKKLKMEDLSVVTDDEFDTKVWVTYTDHGVEKTFEAEGNGPIHAVQRGLQDVLQLSIKVMDFSQHALQQGSNAQAAAYIELMDEKENRSTHGVGISSNITRASIRALFSAVNRIVNEN